MSASSLSEETEADFPAQGSARQRLAFALRFAALAPTESNWRGWEFQLADTHLDLITKANPVFETIDPDRRELLMGCGAALHHLKLALKHHGCLGRVELFPDLDRPEWVARIHLGFSRSHDEQEKLLFAALAGGAQQLPPCHEPMVSEATLVALSQTVATERGWLEFTQSETSRQRVLQVALTGAQDSTEVPTDWRAARSARTRFGFEAGPTATKTLPAASVPSVSSPLATLAVVKTKTDDKHGWLAAGQTLARAVLQAQALGLTWAFLNPVRRREAREALRTGIGHKGFAQVILHFGALLAGPPVQPALPMTATATFR